MTRFLPEFYVDVGVSMERKIEAMEALAAQPSLPVQYEILAKYRALEAQITAGMKDCVYAEGFRRIGTDAVR